MVKIVVLYGHPSDPAAFEDYYANQHLPLAAKRRRAVVRQPRVTPGIDGVPEGEATVADIPNFATGGATVMFAEVD